MQKKKKRGRSSLGSCFCRSSSTVILQTLWRTIDFLKCTLGRKKMKKKKSKYYLFLANLHEKVGRKRWNRGCIFDSFMQPKIVVSGWQLVVLQCHADNKSPNFKCWTTCPMMLEFLGLNNTRHIMFSNIISISDKLESKIMRKYSMEKAWKNQLNENHAWRIKLR